MQNEQNGFPNRSSLGIDSWMFGVNFLRHSSIPPQKKRSKNSNRKFSPNLGTWGHPDMKRSFWVSWTEKSTKLPLRFHGSFTCLSCFIFYPPCSCAQFQKTPLEETLFLELSRWQQPPAMRCPRNHHHWNIFAHPVRWASTHCMQCSGSAGACSRTCPFSQFIDCRPYHHPSTSVPWDSARPEKGVRHHCPHNDSIANSAPGMVAVPEPPINYWIFKMSKFTTRVVSAPVVLVSHRIFWTPR